MGLCQFSTMIPEPELLERFYYPYLMRPFICHSMSPGKKLLQEALRNYSACTFCPLEVLEEHWSSLGSMCFRSPSMDLFIIMVTYKPRDKTGCGSPQKASFCWQGVLKQFEPSSPGWSPKPLSLGLELIQNIQFMFSIDLCDPLPKKPPYLHAC